MTDEHAPGCPRRADPKPGTIGDTALRLCSCKPPEHVTTVRIEDGTVTWDNNPDLREPTDDLLSEEELRIVEDGFGATLRQTELMAREIRVLRDEVATRREIAKISLRDELAGRIVRLRCALLGLAQYGPNTEAPNAKGGCWCDAVDMGDDMHSAACKQARAALRENS